MIDFDWPAACSRRQPPPPPPPPPATTPHWARRRPGETAMSLRAEACELSKLATPIMAVSMLQFLMVMVDMAMVGRLGTKELAASALANTFFNCLQHPVVGCATALDTLLAQSFGAKQYSAYGAWTKAGVLTLLVLSVPVAGLLLAAEPLLLLIDQDAELAERAGVFCRLLVPGILPFFCFIGLSKYLLAQNILAPAVYIALLANVFNAFMNWLLIYHVELGFEGAPIATSLSRWAQCLGLLVYLRCSRARHSQTLPTWQDPEGVALGTRVSGFLKLGAPGALMLGLEAWSFETTTLLAGYLGTVPLAAHMVLINTVGFTFLSFPFALGIASSIRVGWLLGSRQAEAARTCGKVCFVLMVGFMIGLSGLKVAIRQHLGRIFSDDLEVIDTVAQLVYIAALFQISDGCQAAVAGILRGMGRQRVVAALNFVGFWLIGISCGAGLAFGTAVGVAGLWWGLLIGLTCTAALGLVLLLRTDWEDQVRQAQQRVGSAATDDSGKLKGGVEQEMDEEQDEVFPATSVGNVAVVVP
jgi:MATE family multidrug resistance protein